MPDAASNADRFPHYKALFEGDYTRRIRAAIRIRAKCPEEALLALLGALETEGDLPPGVNAPIDRGVIGRSIINGILGMMCFVLLVGIAFWIVCLPARLIPLLGIPLDFLSAAVLIFLIGCVCPVNHWELRDLFPRYGAWIQVLYLPAVIGLSYLLAVGGSASPPNAHVRTTFLVALGLFYAAGILYGINQFLESVITRAKCFAILQHANNVDRASYVRQVRTAIEEIGGGLTRRLEKYPGGMRALLCRQCLTRVSEYAPKSALHYAHCRSCGRIPADANGWWRTPQVAAILSQDLTEEIAQHDGYLCVNWHQRQSLFDFDSVHIQKASDLEVERFIMAVMNDTDSVRRDRAKQVPCSINPTCGLSTNTLNMLSNTFANVRYYNRAGQTT